MEELAYALPRGHLGRETGTSPTEIGDIDSTDLADTEVRNIDSTDLTETHLRYIQYARLFHDVLHGLLDRFVALCTAELKQNRLADRDSNAVGRLSVACQAACQEVKDLESRRQSLPESFDYPSGLALIVGIAVTVRDSVLMVRDSLPHGEFRDNLEQLAAELDDECERHIPDVVSVQQGDLTSSTSEINGHGLLSLDVAPPAMSKFIVGDSGRLKGLTDAVGEDVGPLLDQWVIDYNAWIQLAVHHGCTSLGDLSMDVLRALQTTLNEGLAHVDGIQRPQADAAKLTRDPFVEVLNAIKDLLPEKSQPGPTPRSKKARNRKRRTSRETWQTDLRTHVSIVQEEGTLLFDLSAADDLPYLGAGRSPGSGKNIHSCLLACNVEVRKFIGSESADLNKLFLGKLHGMLRRAATELDHADWLTDKIRTEIQQAMDDFASRMLTIADARHQLLLTAKYAVAGPENFELLKTGRIKQAAAAAGRLAEIMILDAVERRLLRKYASMLHDNETVLQGLLGTSSKQELYHLFGTDASTRDHFVKPVKGLRRLFDPSRLEWPDTMTDTEKRCLADLRSFVTAVTTQLDRVSEWVHGQSPSADRAPAD